MSKLKELTIDGVNDRIDSFDILTTNVAQAVGMVTALHRILGCLKKQTCAPLTLKRLTIKNLDELYELVVQKDDGGFINPILYHKGFKFIFDEAKNILMKKGDG